MSCWYCSSTLVSYTKGGWVAGSSPFTVMTIFTVRNKFAKVMFLHVSVCPRGVCLSACWDTLSEAGPLEQTPPGDRHPPTEQTATVADGTHPTGMHSCFTTEFSENIQGKLKWQ